MGIAHNTDYLDEARGRLPQQFAGKPRIDGLVQSLMAELQAAEDAGWAVFVDRLLQNNPSNDDVLNKIGDIVGQSRNGSSNAEYLSFIRARIRSNKSDGTRETLIAIVLLLLGQTTIVQVREYIKTIELEANGVTINSYTVLRDFLLRAKPAGTSLYFFASPAAKNHTLTRTSVSGGVTTVSTQRKGSVSVGGIGGGVFAASYGG